MLEIRPGTGGEEAALFAGDLLRMYQRYCETRGWTFDVIEEQQSEIGGIKEVVVHIKGEGVFARMKYESGVHRVQRVPETESGGACIPLLRRLRYLPEAEDVDIHIDANDLRIDTMRSSGAGAAREHHGSAVRITHFPQGWCDQFEKSQHRNREIAMQVLKRAFMIWNVNVCMMNVRQIASRRLAQGIALNAFAPIISPKAA